MEQGVDSIMAVEIRTWFLKELNVDIPVLLILSATVTIDDLVDKCMNSIPPDTPWATWDKPTLTNGDSHKSALTNGDSHKPALTNGVSHKPTLTNGDSHKPALTNGDSHKPALTNGDSH